MAACTVQHPAEPGEEPGQGAHSAKSMLSISRVALRISSARPLRLFSASLAVLYTATAAFQASRFTTYHARSRSSSTCAHVHTAMGTAHC